MKIHNLWNKRWFLFMILYEGASKSNITYVFPYLKKTFSFINSIQVCSHTSTNTSCKLLQKWQIYPFIYMCISNRTEWYLWVYHIIIIIWQFADGVMLELMAIITITIFLTFGEVYSNTLVIPFERRYCKVLVIFLVWNKINLDTVFIFI